MSEPDVVVDVVVVVFVVGVIVVVVVVVVVVIVGFDSFGDICDGFILSTLFSSSISIADLAIRVDANPFADILIFKG